MIRTFVAAPHRVAHTRSFSTTISRRQHILPKSNSPIVSKLEFFNSVTGGPSLIPTYRVLDGGGNLIHGAELPQVFLFTQIGLGSYHVTFGID